MEVGDLVKYRSNGPAYEDLEVSKSTGIVVDMTERKVFRGPGAIVNWDIIKPEPHAVVLWNHLDDTVNMPVSELKVVNEGR